MAVAPISLLDRVFPCRSILASVDGEVAARLRARQIGALLRVTPFMLAANMIMASLVVYMLHSAPGSDLLYFWAVMIGLVIAIGVESYRRNRRRGQVHSASPKGLTKAVRSGFVLGLMWGMLPVFYIPEADPAAHYIVSVLMVGLLGGGAMSLYVVPRAMFAYLAAMAAGCLLGLALSGTAFDLALAAMLLLYVGVLMVAGSSMAATYAASVISEAELKEKTETISLLLKDFSEGASDWLWQTDAVGRIIVGAARFEALFGVPLTHVTPLEGKEPGKAAIPDIEGLAGLWRHVEHREAFTDIVLSVQHDNQYRWVSLSGKPLYGHDGEFVGYRGVASDITESRNSEERISFLAHNDALTGLVNRTKFSHHVSEMIADRRVPFWAVMYLDLDGFKMVNDRRGHATGDSLLEAVAARLREQVREGDVVARLGGDEFAILCRSAGASEALSAIAERIVQALSAPYELPGGHRISDVGVSIGIAIGGADGRTQRELLNNADLALYRAKSEGKGTFRFFEMEMDEVVRNRRALEHDLREAVRARTFTVAYQPIVDYEGSRTVGFEALLRWNHPERGEVSPSVFVPIAESMGLISGVGDWVIREACRQAASFPHPIAVAVNLSPQQFRYSDVVKSVRAALQESGLEPSRLELEITEGLFMENTEGVSRVLRELKEMGISIALDDFGTGYSSLSYLLKFPFDKLKIDRSFIAAIDTDPVARDVLESIARLGRVLDLKVTAEGIETREQVEAMRGLDCAFLQGFLFGKPLAADDIPAYLASETARIAREAIERPDRRIAQRRLEPGRREEDFEEAGGTDSEQLSSRAR